MTESGKCKICNHPERDAIEREILRGTTYARIAELYPASPERGIPELNGANISSHRNKHLHPAVKKETIMEYEGLAVKSYAESLAQIIHKLELILERSLQDLETTRVSPRDGIAAAMAMLKAMEAAGKRKGKVTVTDIFNQVEQSLEELEERKKEIDITPVKQLDTSADKPLEAIQKKDEGKDALES